MKHKQSGRYLIIAVFVVLIAGLIIALSINRGGIGTYTYENGEYGFTLELPDEWEGQFVISDDDRYEGVPFFMVKEDGSQGGHLFSIIREVGELITDEDIKQSPIPSKLLMQANGYSYIAYFPSDIQFNLEEVNETESYKLLEGKVDEICQSIKPYGNERPVAANDGYKVVGNSFFTLEIPEHLEMEIGGDFLFWVLKDNDMIVGSLNIIQGQQIEEEGSQLKSVYITRPDTNIHTYIDVNGGTISVESFDMIKNTFTYKTSSIHIPATVLDYLDVAEQYLELGGSRLFGKITDISMVEPDENESVGLKTPVVTVALMQFIADNTEPNGFRLVDLNETRILEGGYSHSPDVIPLVPPNYNTFGVYDRYLLDENFFREYGDENKVSYYKNYYYDFILHPDGSLLLISGHYIP